MSDLNSSDIVHVETTCELCGKQGDLAHGIFVCGPCCETGEEKRLRARIRELEAALDKLAGQNPIRHFENGDCCHCGAFLSDDEPHEIDCPWIKAINILSRNEAQPKAEERSDP